MEPLSGWSRGLDWGQGASEEPSWMGSWWEEGEGDLWGTDEIPGQEISQSHPTEARIRTKAAQKPHWAGSQLTQGRNLSAGTPITALGLVLALCLAPQAPLSLFHDCSGHRANLELVEGAARLYRKPPEVTAWALLHL